MTGSLTLLKLCAKYYREGQLTAQCGSGRCPEVPDVCSQHNAIHTIFHYLTDEQFSKQQVKKYLYYIFVFSVLYCSTVPIYPPEKFKLIEIFIIPGHRLRSQTQLRHLLSSFSQELPDVGVLQQH